MARAVHATGKPIVVVYVSGSPIAEPWLQDKANAILNSWEPGSFGGQAIAEVMFGEVNPSGKLPVTIPQRGAVADGLQPQAFDL
ncbi:MAG: glycoside hydrolase family 3 C-terminal domain-containing protein [Saprospiraceae bacterium]